MSRSRRTDPSTAPAAGAPHGAPAQPGQPGSARDVARAVVGITGDKNIPSWAEATTDRARRRVVALQAVAASEAAGAVALILLLRVAGGERDWSDFSFGVLVLLAGVGYAFAALHGVDRFAPNQRVRTIQLMSFNGAVATLICGIVVPVLPILVVLVIIRSVFYGLQVASFRTLVYDAVVPEVRVRAFARVTAGAMAGAAIGALLGAAAVAGPEIEPAAAVVLVGIISGLLALFSLRLTEPGIGGVEPARIERAFGASRRAEALRMPMRESIGRVLQVHTVRTSLSSYVAIGALGWALVWPFVLVTASIVIRDVLTGGGEPPSPGTLLLALAAVFLVVGGVVVLVGQGMEKARRVELRGLVQVAWLAPVILGAFAAFLLAFFAFDGLLVAAAFVIAIALVGGALGKVALDVTTLSVVTAQDRPVVAALTNFSWIAGGVLAAIIVPWDADTVADSTTVVRTGFAILFVLLVVAAFVGKRLMQQPDPDLDAVLPIAAEEILEETPTQEVTGLTPEVSPYAYVAPPAAVLDASGRPPLLSAEKVNFAYGSVPVLFDVDITVGEGELVAVLGPNGVGKTTLLRCLSGLEIPQQGVVRFNGEDVTKTTASKRVTLGLSQIVGGNAVFGSLTVAENLQMYGYSVGSDRKAVQEGVARAYEIFPRLADRRSQLGSTLSGGEQQMLGLSKALILRPHLLVVDEFSLGLAPVVVGELLAMVRQLNAEGTAVLLVEQSVNVALNLVDRCYFMEKGRVVYEGRADALRARPDLVQALSLGGLPHELEENAV